MDAQIWAVFYAGLVSIQMHPRNEILDHDAMLEYCAKLADLMLLRYKERFSCPG